MSGLIGENNGSYPFLNRFSTKTLRQLLREDFTSKEPSTPESDTFITCVAEVVWRSLQTLCQLQDTDAAPAEGDAGDTAGALEADLSRMAAQWNQLQRGGETDGQRET